MKHLYDLEFYEGKYIQGTQYGSIASVSFCEQAVGGKYAQQYFNKMVMC